MNLEAADLQAVPGRFVHVQVTDGVLQASLGAALRDWLGDGGDIELGHLGIVVCAAAGSCQLPQLFLLLHEAADGTTRGGYGAILN